MRIILLLLGISFSIAVCGQKENANTLKWRNDPAVELKIDDSEYSKDKKGLVMYYISNDSGNIYVDMKIKETLEQNKILKIGMTIWICLDGKSQKKTGIRYPIGSDYTIRKTDYENTINPPTPLSQATSIQLIGFKDVQPSKFSSDNKDNIRGKVKYNDAGDLIYRLIIPMAKLSVLKEENTEPGLMTIGFEYGAPPQPQGQGGGMPPMSSGSRSGGGRPPSGGSRSSGGSSGGGAPSGAPKPSSATTEMGSPVLFWVKEISLAKK